MRAPLNRHGPLLKEKVPLLKSPCLSWYFFCFPLCIFVLAEVHLLAYERGGGAIIGVVVTHCAAKLPILRAMAGRSPHHAMRGKNLEDESSEVMWQHSFLQFLCWSCSYSSIVDVCRYYIYDICPLLLGNICEHCWIFKYVACCRPSEFHQSKRVVPRCGQILVFGLSHAASQPRSRSGQRTQSFHHSYLSMFNVLYSMYNVQCSVFNVQF